MTAEGDAASFLAHALSERPDGPLVVVLEAPAADPLEVLRRVRRSDAWLLSRTDGEGLDHVLGLGSSRRVELSGQARMERLAQASREGPAWHVARQPTAAAHLAGRLPLSFVGLAFDVGATDDEAWRGHGDGVLVTPRWTYLRRGEQAVLAWASVERWSGQAAVVSGELEALLGALRAPATPRAMTRSRVVSQTTSSLGAWVDHVEAARRAIGQGSLRKVVVARRTVLATAGDVCAEDVLAALPAEGALRYLVRQGSSVLVGATPERLFCLRGASLRTEALAGTRSRAHAGAAESLLGSAKDLDEHEPVVAAIAASLEGLGASVCVAPCARVKAVANLLHLRTEILAELREGSAADAASVIAAMHPTPAVGGWPSAEARAFIRAHEPPRGWYAGPLGWIDAAGDADLHVVLRCALLRGARAWVYAGGGIVATSDPLAEWDETALKMAPLLDALGGRPEHRAADPVSRTTRAGDVSRGADAAAAEASR